MDGFSFEKQKHTNTKVMLAYPHLLLVSPTVFFPRPSFSVSSLGIFPVLVFPSSFSPPSSHLFINSVFRRPLSRLIVFHIQQVVFLPVFLFSFLSSLVSSPPFAFFFFLIFSSSSSHCILLPPRHLLFLPNPVFSWLRQLHPPKRPSS